MKQARFLLCTIVLLAMAFCITGCGSNNKNTQQNNAGAAQQINYTERTFTILDKLSNGKIGEFYGYFDEAMKEQVSQADMQKLWNNLVYTYGAFDYYKTDIVLKTQDGYQIADVPCVFEKGTVTLRLTLNTKGEISGFFVSESTTTGNSLLLENDTEVTFGSETYPLSGSLTLPEGEGPFPAVILVHGSGPNDRNEQVGPNMPFKDLAEQLSANGIAVLRYDKRTYLYGKALAEQTDLTVQEETIEDVVYALSYLQSIDAIAEDHIYIAGHSLGGYLMPRIAAQTPQAAGYILLAAPARPMEDLILEQTEYILSVEQNLDDTAKEKLLQQTIAQVDAIKSVTPGTTLTIEQLGGAPASYWLDLQNYDPLKEVQQIDKPFLILQGGRDYQVSNTDYELWQSAFDAYSDVHFRYYDDLNHLFMTGTGKSVPDEYQHQGTVADDVSEDIANFVRDHAAIQKQASKIDDASANQSKNSNE